MGFINRTILLSVLLVLVLHIPGDVQGDLLGGLTETVGGLLESITKPLTDGLGKLTSGLLASVLGLTGNLTEPVKKLLDGIVGKVNKGLPLSVKDIQKLLETLGVCSISELPKPVIKKLGKILNTNAIAKLEKHIEKPTGCKQ